MDGYADGVWLVRCALQRGLAAIYLVAFLGALNQFRPLLGEQGRIDRLVLGMMDGGATLEEIARAVQRGFPERNQVHLYGFVTFDFVARLFTPAFDEDRS